MLESFLANKNNDFDVESLVCKRIHASIENIRNPMVILLMNKPTN